MKRNEVFVFLDGSLTVKMEGHEAQNGWGRFSWDEEQVEYIPHEEQSGSSVAVDIPRSELIELRDFLMRVFPPEAGRSVTETDGDDYADRAEWQARR